MKPTNIGMEVVVVGVKDPMYYLLFNGKNVGPVIGKTSKGMSYYGKPAIPMTKKQWLDYTKAQVDEANVKHHSEESMEQE